MIKHVDVMNRCLSDNDYPALMAVETACDKDVDAALDEYNQAVDVYGIESEKARSNGTAGLNYAADKAYIEMCRKYVAYLEKSMLNSQFRGYYKN